MNRRDFLAAGIATVATASMATAAEPSPRANLGLLLYSYGLRSKADRDQGFTDPVRFLEFAHQRGANAVQMPLGLVTQGQATNLRQICDRLKMRVEGIVSPPKDDGPDLHRFSSELESAERCGASLVRTVMLGGRRYEVFERAEEFPAFTRRSEEALKRACGIAEKHRVVLAVENHKDFRVEEMIDLLRKVSSEWIGVCLDTGNNLALLDDPLSAVTALAPYTRTVHLKDIGVEESENGFLMAEVPLGQGTFDLPKMVATIRAANPQAMFQLEMITRDPLSIPCLTEKYWLTLPTVPGRDLARTIANVRKQARKTPLPRISSFSPDKQLATEDRHVRESFEFATRTGLIPA